MNRVVLTIWLGWLAVMTGANLAAPLYAVYAQRFAFSSLVLTLVFATYAATLVPSLVLFGRLSDSIGRRPVLLAGLTAAAVGLALFATARSTAWLFAARACQGLAVGMISGTATAALVEADAGGPKRRPAMLAGLAQAGGSALGPLIAGVLAEWAPAPRALCFLLVLAVTVVAAFFTALVPEPGARDREPWRPQWPRVPAGIRSDFVRVGVTGGLVWAAVALYLSIVPSDAGHILQTHDLAVLGGIGALALGASCVSLVLSRRLPHSPRRHQAAGLAMLAAGLLALAAAGPTQQLAVLLVGAVLTGAGQGLALLDAQDELNTIAPDERRGEVTAAFVSCIYTLVAAAVIGAGVLDQVVSLSHAVGVVAVVLAVTALAASAWQAGVRSVLPAVLRGIGARA
ncbi:MAG TPA: MFS transporter [Gaiellaceae bacterium]